MSTTHPIRQRATRLAATLAYRAGQHVLASITQPGPRDQETH